MKLRLVKLKENYKRHLFEMMDEWYKTEENIVPYVIRKNDYHDFEYYLENLETKEEGNGLVPDSTYFCLDEERDIFVGAVNIRHYLNEGLLKNGGHIGDGVRPSERRKGIATKMIALALEKCREIGIDKVLMVCNKDNIASAKSIISNGGVLENEITDGDIVEQRYWIKIYDHKEDIRIVKATKDDAEGIIEYCKIIGGETDNLSYGSEGIHQNVESEQKILEEFKNADNKVFFLAKQGDKIVGNANFVGYTKERMKHRGTIGISVLKSMWGKHIGTILMEHIIEYAINTAKVDIISLEVRSDNERAIALYTKFGFKKIGTFKGFFKVNGEYVDFDLMNLEVI